MRERVLLVYTEMQIEALGVDVMTKGDYRARGKMSWFWNQGPNLNTSLPLVLSSNYLSFPAYLHPKKGVKIWKCQSPHQIIDIYLTRYEPLKILTIPQISRYLDYLLFWQPRYNLQSHKVWHNYFWEKVVIFLPSCNAQQYSPLHQV